MSVRETGRSGARRVGSIDAGTNTFRLLIAELEGPDRFLPLHVSRDIIRLGRGFRARGMISEEAARRALSTLQGYAATLREYGAQEVRAVATSVCREASNGPAFLDRVRAETGIPLEAIVAAEEARLALKGALTVVSADGGPLLLVDIGGGSTEFVLARRDRPADPISLPLGVVHLTEEFLRHDPPAPAEMAALQAHLDRALAAGLAAYRPLLGQPGLTLVGTAGTITTLAAMELGLEVYDPARVNHLRLSRAALSRLLGALTPLPARERLRIRPLEPGREDVIVAGALILAQVMEWFQVPEVVVSDGGLLEGLILDGHFTPIGP